MTPHQEVVITGVGSLGAHGIGLEALAAALQQGRALASPVVLDRGYHRPGSARLCAQVPEVDLSPWLDPMAARRMSLLSQYAVAASRMAMEHAGRPAVASERLAVAMATAFGPGEFTEQLVRQIHDKGGRAASPFLFTDCVANAAAGQIAIDLGARGPNTTLCAREAGPLLALQQGVRDIALGRADVCLCGAVDEVAPLVHAILDRFRALARAEGGRRELPRPFARNRNGALAGGGAAVLVLEAGAHAEARGARILARVGALARVFDPSAGRASHGRDAAGLAEAVRARLGAELPGIELIVSGAAGGRRGDLLEARVLHRLFRELPPVVVPKAVHGEFGGGTLAAGVLAACGTSHGMPEGCDEPDPRCGIVPATGEHRPRRVLLTAHAAGGAAAFVCLERP